MCRIASLVISKLGAPTKRLKSLNQMENFNVFDFELSSEDMDAIVPLDTKKSLFFDHRDPENVKRLGNRKLDI